MISFLYFSNAAFAGTAALLQRHERTGIYVADTHTLFATPLAGAFDRGARFRQFSLGPGVIGGLAASTPDGI
jgi:hypothetical protein